MTKVSLQIRRFAIAKLLSDALPQGCEAPTLSHSAQEARILLGFDNDRNEVGLLKSIFEIVKLTDRAVPESIVKYLPLQQIEGQYPEIPYPIALSLDALSIYRKRIAQELQSELLDRWADADFLAFILEKYGSCVSYGDPYVALVDATNIWVAIATIYERGIDSDLCLVAGNLSGIQKFIYTISSDGALKSLRARSFYLELVTEEFVQQLLHRLQLPRSSVIYAGGGNLYLLAPTDKIDQLPALHHEFNDWLDQTLQGKVFLSLAHQTCSKSSIKSAAFRQYWNNVIASINRQKLQRYEGRIDRLQIMLQPRQSYPPCGVCHRDDERNLARLNPLDEGSPLACPSCCDMLSLGSVLPNVSAILRTQRPQAKQSRFSLPIFSSNYHLYDRPDPHIEIERDLDTLYLVNNWENNNYYQISKTVPLLLGNYYKPQIDEDEPDRQRFPTAEELANKSEGIPRIGYLRMDVDRLGQIFAFGLGDSDYSLPRVAGLSRQLSYFFKVYLNSLAHDRQKNLYDRDNSLTKFSQINRQNLLFIYAGGDDLFISGAWNEVIEFAMDTYQSFRAFTGWNPDITLSGGISIDDPKFPLYQAAATSGEAEHQAKSNERDSLCAFSQSFKWQEWFGNRTKAIITTLRDREQEYWNKADPNPDFTPQVGIIPLVTLLLEKTKNNTLSRGFLRNLLQTADMQDRLIMELNNRQRQSINLEECQDIRYYLHLPQIAYTIARLPPEARDDSDLRKALKCPYNAPYFRAIATWIELLSRSSSKSYDQV